MAGRHAGTYHHENWNTYQYACLILMLAQVCDMEPGEFVHIDANCHIYDRHVETIKELIQREPLPAPEVWINPDIHDFYKFTSAENLQKSRRYESPRIYTWG